MSDRSIRGGIDVYNEWHAKDPAKLKKVKINLPQEVFAIGKGEMIAYRSGKWQKGNKTEDYEHEFTSRPTLYHSSGEGRARSVDGLLKNEVVVDLGYCIELLYTDLDGEDLEIKVGGARTTRMVCTSDKKTLIILHKKGPIFINGGQMRITSRGIVK